MKGTVLDGPRDIRFEERDLQAQSEAIYATSTFLIGRAVMLPSHANTEGVIIVGFLLIRII
jgi:hypothetical protein